PNIADRPPNTRGITEITDDVIGQHEPDAIKRKLARTHSVVHRQRVDGRVIAVERSESQEVLVGQFDSMPGQQIVKYFRPRIGRENVDRDFVRALPCEVKTIADGLKYVFSRLVRKANDKISPHDDALTLSLQNGGCQLV